MKQGLLKLTGLILFFSTDFVLAFTGMHYWTAIRDIIYSGNYRIKLTIGGLLQSAA